MEMLNAAKISQNDLILFPIFQTLRLEFKPIQILSAHSRPTRLTFPDDPALVAGMDGPFRQRSRSVSIIRTANCLNTGTESSN